MVPVQVPADNNSQVRVHVAADDKYTPQSLSPYVYCSAGNSLGTGRRGRVQMYDKDRHGTTAESRYKGTVCVSNSSTYGTRCNNVRHPSQGPYVIETNTTLSTVSEKVLLKSLPMLS
jgi:hypothetical protein